MASFVRISSVSCRDVKVWGVRIMYVSARCCRNGEGTGGMAPTFESVGAYNIVSPTFQTELCCINIMYS